MKISPLTIIPLLLASCLLIGLDWLLQPKTAASQDDCATFYDPGDGWIVDMCPTDPAVTVPMTITLNGTLQGSAALIRVYHQTQAGSSFPQVAVLYASGYIRLKQNDDPVPSLPFGSSFILGPAYWPNETTYYHQPQLTHLEIDTSRLPAGPLRMWGKGSNQDFAVSYDLVLPSPTDWQTRLHVTQHYTATTAVTIDPTRRAEAQGFKLVQISSMFINEGGVCDGGQTDCHDSNALRFIGNDLTRHQVAFTDVSPSSFIMSTTLPLGSTWLDALHTDDQGWQGNTPNIRIALDALPPDHTITPQGWLEATTDPNEDNVGLWLHDDGPASQSWAAGQSGQISYWLLAQDNPPEPWHDFDLRSGWTFLDFQGSDNCFLVKDINQSTSGVVEAVAGYSDTALQLIYDLGNDNGNWVQLRCDFDPPLDLSAYDHLRFDWRGDPDAANSLEVALVNPGSPETIFGRGYHHATHHSWWGQMVVPFNFLQPWTDSTTFDPSQVSAFFVSVVKDPVDDVGGNGRLAIDNLNAFNAAARTVPSTFTVSPDLPQATNAAVAWLATQQQPTGLLKSWAEDLDCAAHTYDQALALLAFMQEGRWSEADALVTGLVSTQNANGSWYKSRNCLTLEVLDGTEWEGDIAWAIYALDRYLALGGTHPQAVGTRDAAAAWLATHINPGDGCLVIDHTEGTIDAWWAFYASGSAYSDEAAGLQNCLLTYYWDETMGRFKGGRSWQQPYLDNQTWGSAFLQAIGEAGKARRALSYAWETLRLPAQGGQIRGFDGQAGPWSVWNEGIGQYIAVGGSGPTDLLPELLAQQELDGAMPGSPNDFSGGGVWTTRWHGVAPTAWFYFALAGGPFSGRLDSVNLDGSTNGFVNTGYPFTATVSPITTTQPLLYVWQSTGHSAITHTAGLSDTASFTWETPGLYSILVTVTNGLRTVTETHLITITNWQIYLPMVARPLIMDPIVNGGDGNYHVSWPCVGDAYILQEDDDPKFASPNIFAITTCNYTITGRVRGTYYYRVRTAEQEKVGIWSNTAVAIVEYLTIEDFDDGYDPNSIGGLNGWYGPCVLPSPSDYFSEGSGYALYLSYNVTPTCYAAWQTDLLGLDYSGFSTVSFHVKGALGNEQAHIYLQNSPTQRSYVDINDYLPANHITDDWQSVLIPLTAFTAGGVNLATLQQFQCVFEWDFLTGTIFIDDIRFE